MSSGDLFRYGIPPGKRVAASDAAMLEKSFVNCLALNMLLEQTLVAVLCFKHLKLCICFITLKCC